MNCKWGIRLRRDHSQARDTVKRGPRSRGEHSQEGETVRGTLKRRAGFRTVDSSRRNTFKRRAYVQEKVIPSRGADTFKRRGYIQDVRRLQEEGIHSRRGETPRGGYTFKRRKPRRGEKYHE